MNTGPEMSPVDAVICRLEEAGGLDADALDWIELIGELYEEFGTTTVDRAIRLMKGRVKASGASADRTDPLWDRDLDG